MPRNSKPARKMGRPRAAENKKRNRYVTYFDDDEKAEFENKCKSVNLSSSVFLNRAALSRRILPPPPAVNFKTLFAINHAAQNLNQLTELLRRERPEFDLRSVEAMISELQKAISRARLELIGRTAFEIADEEEQEINQH